ncbi:hypothetical protein [Azospirillum argentinense]
MPRPEFPNTPPTTMAAPRTVLNVGCGPRDISIIGTVFPAEGWRELRPDISPKAVPDVQSAARLVAEDRIDEPLCQSGASPIFPLDAIHGFGPALAAGDCFTGQRNGFAPVTVWRLDEDDLRVLTYRPPAPANALDRVAWDFPAA